ncbi:MAG: DNA alkylation repair protein [Deltaproteobacteria bacterium]|nr:DNA alkylation repair protein [Deltaproteobacteria bacterium]
MTKPTTFEQYVAPLPADQRRALETLRKQIIGAAPDVQEYIGYGLPGFKLHGRPLLYIGAAKSHCAIYGARAEGALVKKLAAFKQSKGTIQFVPAHPIPAAVVKAIVKARVQANNARAATKTKASAKPVPSKLMGKAAPGGDLKSTLAWLKQEGTKKTLDSMGRYGITATKAFGVTVGELKAYAKGLGKNHVLAEQLWASGWYEARMLASFVGDPNALTAKQMDAWASDFDSWAICDSICFHLFDRSPLAFSKVKTFASAKPEFKKRAAFATLWGLTVHDKKAGNDSFLNCLPLIEKAATDDRAFVKKGVDMALRAMGKRNGVLHAAALALAKKLAVSTNASSAWIGRSASRELSKVTPRG